MQEKPSDTPARLDPRTPWGVIVVTFLCITIFISSRYYGLRLGLAAEASENESGDEVSLRHYDVVACNRTNFPEVSVAAGYFHSNYNDWLAKGWTVIKQNDCVKLLDNADAPIYAYVAELEKTSKLATLPTALFCVHQFEPFTLRFSACQAGKSNADLMLLPFQELPVTGAGGDMVWEIGP